MKDLSRAYEERVEEISVLKQKIEGLEQAAKAHIQAERYQQLTAEILGILNNPSALSDAISLMLSAIKRETGFDAVGIRLRSSDDFPYFVQEGFSNDFLLTENTLVVRTKDGGPCRDNDGNYSLECTCGLVLSGQTDPTNPLFTVGGSAWTNNSLTLLDLSPDQDPRLHPRNRCVHEGFLSVALIPIRENQEIIGLLQLNDRRKDCFILDMIHFFEGISGSIGVALKRKQAEEALLSAHRRISDLLASISDAFFALDNDLVVTYFNAAAERMLGRKAEEVLGYPLFGAFPEARGSVFEEHYRSAIKEKKFRSFEVFFDIQPYRNWYEVRVYPQENGLSVFFQITTQRKEAEEEIRRLNAELEVRVQERTAELAQRNEELTAEITERLKMEQALQKSREQLRILASQILSAQEIERKRVALEVHDVLGSSLSAIKFKAEEALGHLPQDGTLNTAVSKPLETLIPLIKETIEEARRIQSDLRPPLLDDLGILPTLSWFCRRFETIYSGIEVEQAVTLREEEVPDHLKIVLFRVTQEALNNIGKYAKADSVYLGLRKVDGVLELCIKDNGEGFDPESLSSRDNSTKRLGFIRHGRTG